MKIKIEKLIYEGFGLGRNEQGKPIFVRKSVPGDVLEVEIIKDKKSFAEAKIVKIIEPSSSRIGPVCPHFYSCGGCDHQNISYPNQLKFKEDIFKETLSRAGIETEILPIIPGSKDAFYYRNSIRFFFDKTPEVKIAFARHDYLDYKGLVQIEKCYLQSEFANKLLTELRKMIDEKVEHKSGLWQLKIREGKTTGEFMVEIITTDESLPAEAEFKSLLKSFPEIKSAWHTVAPAKSLRNLHRRLLFGSPIIFEKIGKFTFQISPESFFQTNSLGVKTLYDKIKEFAEIKMGDTVLDLFCGTGTIGVYLSTLAKRVIGVEIVQEAINDAKANARINKVSNCEFVCADTEKCLSSGAMKQSGHEAMKIIVDPPRGGLSPKTLYELSTLNFTNLIYVSCNPATFARDIKEFEKRGVKLTKVQPIDMFPQTHHIEVVGVLKKISR